MANIINELQPRATSPDTNNPDAAVASAQQPEGGRVQSVQQKFPLLADLVRGNPPAVFAPKGFQPPPELAAMTSPPVIKHLGLGVYRPHDPEIVAVLFNPAKITLQALQKADKAGKLDEVAKPVSEYFGGGPAGAQDGPTGGLIGNQTTQEQPANAPSPNPVSVMPRPTFGADAQKMAAEQRSKNFAPAGPTAGPVPGGGTILNSLLKRAQ